MAHLDRYYKILGLEPGASPEEVKQAYRDLCRVWHPDRFPNDPRLQQKAQEKQKEINEAYEHLKSFRPGPGSRTPPGESQSQGPGRTGAAEHRSRRPGTPYERETTKRETRESGSQEARENGSGPSPSKGSSASPLRVGIWVIVAVAFIIILALASLDPQSQKTPDPVPSSPTTPNQSQAQPPRATLSLEDLELLKKLRPDVDWSPAEEGSRSRATRPQVSERHPVSLPSGTEIMPPRGTKGLGTLRIINGTDQDAVVKLVGSTVPRTTYRFVYTRANSEATIKGVGPGTYVLKFGLGVDWDQRSLRFLRNRSYFQFVDPLHFQETKTRYAEYEFTLHRVPGGTAHTTTIDESTF